MNLSVSEIEPNPESLVATWYDPPDYRDSFLVERSGHATVDDFSAAYFSGQPRWLALVSMNTPNVAEHVASASHAGWPVGASVGSWKVKGRSNDEIVFGDSLGFMEFVISFLRHADGGFEASTAVQYRWSRMSRLYFGAVKPIHRRFVPHALRSTARADDRSASLAATTING